LVLWVWAFPQDEDAASVAMLRVAPERLAQALPTLGLVLSVWAFPRDEDAALVAMIVPATGGVEQVLTGGATNRENHAHSQVAPLRVVSVVELPALGHAH
jgi:hypothetical protein